MGGSSHTNNVLSLVNDRERRVVPPACWRQARGL
jgi:hypothetical protein